MKSKIFAIIPITFAILIVQNLFAQDMRCKRDGNHFQMFQNLNLTEVQQEQIGTLRLSHQIDMVDIKADLQKKKLELAELKNKGNYTREAYLDKVEVINSARNKIAISKANFQMDTYQLLDDNQKKEWNKCSLNFGERKEKRIMRKMKDVKVD
jgi:Spy/CpxP family protein refolding chaperone